MKYGVLGTGNVASTIGGKLIELGHSVMLGSRTAGNPQATEWAKHHGEQAAHGTFADAARFGERIFNCVQGIRSLEVLDAAGKENLNGSWLDTMDLGDIPMSRHTEMLGAFWPAAINGTGNMRWGFRLVR